MRTADGKQMVVIFMKSGSNVYKPSNLVPGTKIIAAFHKDRYMVTLAIGRSWKLVNEAKNGLVRKAIEQADMKAVRVASH
jgi:hypothetical protein